MLKGTRIQLRPIRRDDLEELYIRHTDLANRGDYYPTGVQSESAFYRQFEESGFWGQDSGMLLIVAPDDHIAGHIEHFQTVKYLDEYELSYLIYEPTHRGKGYTTEAVNLMVRYLFGRWKVNRIRLIIHPDNLASRRVAEKCGFTHEGTARGAWYHRGENHDVEVYARLRGEM